MVLSITEMIINYHSNFNKTLHDTVQAHRLFVYMRFCIVGLTSLTGKEEYLWFLPVHTSDYTFLLNAYPYWKLVFHGIL